MTERIDIKDGSMRDSMGLDDRLALRLAEREGHRDKRFERVPLGAARRRDGGLAAGNSDRVIEKGDHHLGQQARAVVDHHDLTAPAVDRGVRPNLLSDVDRVVREFLYDDERPIGDDMASLSDRLALTAKLAQP